MPLLDVVTDVLSDPNFIDSFSVMRNVQAITSGGMAVDTPTIIANVYGVVMPVDNSVIDKFPQGEIEHGDIVIYTRYRLTDGYGTSDFDIITWNGETYQVKSVNDWSRYGPGYIEAVCTLNEVNP
jgi:galactose-6-phosphate isomerase